MSRILKIIAVGAAYAIGFTLITEGVLSVLPAYAITTTHSAFGLSPVKVTLSQHKIFSGTKEINNLSPGDSASGTLVITNSSKTNEWVQLHHKLSGGTNGHPDIFSKYAQSSTYNVPGSRNDTPLQISYSIQVVGKKALNQNISVAPFSTDETSPAFQLATGDKAIVSYKYDFPAEAGNAYQDANGAMSVFVNVDEAIDNGGTVSGGTSPVTGLPFVQTLLAGLGFLSLGIGSFIFSRKLKRH